jgi:hypothetical protein
LSTRTGKRGGPPGNQGRGKAQQKTQQVGKGSGGAANAANAANAAPSSAEPRGAGRTLQATSSSAQRPPAGAQDPRDARRQARLQRQAEARAAAERRRRSARLRRVGIIAAIAVLVAGGVAGLWWREASKPGEAVAQQPSPHIGSVDEPHSYTTDPPTSGPHLSGIAPWGVSSVPITRELQVHNLEDGGVIINYRPDLDKATVDRLADIARGYTTDLIMAPYPDLSHPIVLTTWGRIDRLDALDEARIRRFVDEYRGKDHHLESGS